MCPPILFLDFTYYFGFNKQPVIKEIAYRSLKGDFGGHVIFTPPYSKTILSTKESYTIDWIEKHLDTIPWKDGMEPYTNLNRVLTNAIKYKPKTLLYVKSPEKKKLFSTILSSAAVNSSNIANIVDMETLAIMPSFRELKRYVYPVVYQFSRCYYHNEFCAVGNVNCLVQWYYDNLYTCCNSSSDEEHD